MEKIRKISKNLEEAEDTFYVTLRGGPETNKSFTTEFSNKLYKPLYLKGDYEVAVTNIHFTNVKEMDLGQIEISFKNDNWSYVLLLKIEAKMGDNLNFLFTNINKKIHEMVQEEEYKRRLDMRRNNKMDNTDQLFKYGEKFISLPIKYNPIYDEFVNEEIKEMSPKIIYESDHLSFLTTSDFTFKFHGNMLNLIPELKEKIFNVTSEPIMVRNSHLPSFNTLFISTNIIEPENCGDSKIFPILKIINLENNINKAQSISIGNNDLTFQRINVVKNNIYHTKITDISISIYTDINEKLKFNQGEVILRLFFRKLQQNNLV